MSMEFAAREPQNTLRVSKKEIMLYIEGKQKAGEEY